jgi:hypothetical protein
MFSNQHLAGNKQYLKMLFVVVRVKRINCLGLLLHQFTCKKNNEAVDLGLA